MLGGGGGQGSLDDIDYTLQGGGGINSEMMPLTEEDTVGDTDMDKETLNLLWLFISK